jgi:hypothetical protein
MSTVFSGLFGGTMGGSDNEIGMSIAFDRSGDVVIVGETDASDFPQANSMQTALAGDRDGFILLLDSSFDVKVGSYMGGGSADRAFVVAAMETGEIVLAGETSSSNFPVEQPIQAELAGVRDLFVATLLTSSLAPTVTKSAPTTALPTVTPVPPTAVSATPTMTTTGTEPPIGASWRVYLPVGVYPAGVSQ